MCWSYSVASIGNDGDISPVFELVVLGDSGGSHDGNLSAFLLRPLSDNKYIALDAGTLLNGIEYGLQRNLFASLLLDTQQTLTPSISIMRNHITAYFISHGHLDHVSGLIIASPDDTPKSIYALPSVNQAISDSYFNWQAWPNFSDRGKLPRLNKYKMIDLSLKQSIVLPNSSLSVRTFSLNHPVESTAFIIEDDNNLVAYIGDTSPDDLENEKKLEKVWKYLSRQIKHKKLRGIVIETSFPDSQADDQLYGHLTPSWLTSELTHFSSLLDNKTVLKQTKIIVNHVKKSTLKGIDASEMIQKQLAQRNKLGLTFIMARRGEKILL